MKKFIAGLIVGLMFTSTVSFASQGISATFGNFNFLVNGQAKMVTTQPIVYNGTSYLPVRELSTMLGYDVDYKADTRTIELKTASEVVPTDNQNNDAKNSTPDMSNLIYSRDLYDKYGIDKIGGYDGKGGPFVITYKGIQVETYDYVTIDDKLYFHKNILNQLGIN